MWVFLGIGTSEGQALVFQTEESNKKKCVGNTNPVSCYMLSLIDHIVLQRKEQWILIMWEPHPAIHAFSLPGNLWLQQRNEAEREMQNSLFRQRSNFTQMCKIPETSSFYATGFWRQGNAESKYATIWKAFIYAFCLPMAWSWLGMNVLVSPRLCFTHHSGIEGFILGITVMCQGTRHLWLQHCPVFSPQFSVCLSHHRQVL